MVGQKHEIKVSGKLTVCQVEAVRSVFSIGRKSGFRESRTFTVRNLSTGRQLRDVPASRLGRRLEV